MFGVLVGILGPDHIPGLSLSLGQRKITLVASLRGLRAPHFGPVNIRCPPFRAVSGRRCGFGTVRIRRCFRAILHGSLLSNGR